MSKSIFKFLNPLQILGAPTKLQELSFFLLLKCFGKQIIMKNSNIKSKIWSLIWLCPPKETSQCPLNKGNGLWLMAEEKIEREKKYWKLLGINDEEKKS